MPKFKAEPLERRIILDSSVPGSLELNQSGAMGGPFVPDESKSYYENLKDMYRFNLKKECLKEIANIKLKYFKETGELL